MDKQLRRTFIISIIISLLLTLLTFLLDPLLDSISHLPDTGAAWYYWQLPEANLWAQITAWGGFSLHLLLIFIVIRSWEKAKDKGFGLRKINIIALWINFIFTGLHLLQTHIFYDGLAQDVPVWTSQYSVIIMLIIIMIMLMPRRGIFWGKGKKLNTGVLDFLKKTHSYYISWALIYTFWFHPMEGDFAILMGFSYMFFLFIQMSMFNTRLHVNMKWLIFLEFFVGLHGPAIAIMNKQPIWPMFIVGFLFMTVMTQMHGLKFRNWLKYLILVIYIATVGVLYYFRGFEKLYELSFIPVALYGGVGVLILLILLGRWTAKRFSASVIQP